MWVRVGARRARVDGEDGLVGAQWAGAARPTLGAVAEPRGTQAGRGKARAHQAEGGVLAHARLRANGARPIGGEVLVDVRARYRGDVPECVFVGALGRELAVEGVGHVLVPLAALARHVVVLLNHALEEARVAHALVQHGGSLELGGEVDVVIRARSAHVQRGGVLEGANRARDAGTCLRVELRARRAEALLLRATAHRDQTRVRALAIVHRGAPNGGGGEQGVHISALEAVVVPHRRLVHADLARHAVSCDVGAVGNPQGFGAVDPHRAHDPCAVDVGGVGAVAGRVGAVAGGICEADPIALLPRGRVHEVAFRGRQVVDVARPGGAHAGGILA
mmetsp:Transcript_6741/g.16606  ORF Transcript_6741/g.16606 Transcript_6741/m.16606 type:complete len:335 (+) Transcript_6741:2710-3714(+)